MDAFETIRREAAALHDKAVGHGGDPWAPWSLATHAAALLGCPLATLARGDPLLRGGVGCYDPQGNVIAIEELADEAMRALLAGHELGHVVVHRPADFVVTGEFHTERVPEPSSAIEKLIDYGERERREVQMDLFAREFILPRTRARQLYVTEGLSAAAIAKRSGLPFAVVAQQIFDAVLLPPVPEATEAQPFVAEDNEVQVRAAHHSGSPFLLEAGPGTGKTRTLIMRIEQLIDTGADPGSILVLTFSNKAAGELRDRLAARREDAAAVWIGTFHAFGYDLLKRFSDVAGLPPDPKLIDRVDTVDLIEQVLPALSLKHYRNIYDPTLDIADFLKAISRAKDEVIDAAAYLDLAEKMHRAAMAAGNEEAILEAEKVTDVARVYVAYESLLIDRKRLDFGDLVMRPVELAEQHADIVVKALRARHHHVLVDEYQDVNRASVRLLKAIVGAGDNLWAVGDARQSIYRFRGASSANMALFETDFPGRETASLDINYRSCSEVIDLFTTFSAAMAVAAGSLELNAAKGRGGCQAELRKVETRKSEGAAVAAAILELKGEGVAYRDQAVLCRGNKRLAEVAEALEARDIPTLYLGSLFERSEIKDLMALLALLADPKAATLPRVAAQPRYGMTLQEVANLLALAEDAEQPMAWTGLEGWTSDPEALKRVGQLAQDLKGFGEDSNPWWVVATLVLDRTAEVRTLAGSTRVRDRIIGIALWQFLTFCANLPRGGERPVAAVLHRISRLVLLSEERDLRQMPAAADAMDAVRLMTVHGAKGLEFEAVHVPGLNTSSFPISNSGVRCYPPDGMICGAQHLTGKEAIKAGHVEEEQCLFFVALSRARRHLRLYAANRQMGGNNSSPSSFLGSLGGAVRTIDPAPLYRPDLDTAEEVIPITDLSELELSDAQVQLFNKCPRRFFYTHLLGVPGARRATGFVQMHDAVYKVIGWLKRDPQGREAGLEATRERFEQAWEEYGPAGDPNAEPLKAIGAGLIDYLVESREGGEQLEAGPIRLEFGSVTVAVTPDEIRRGPNGISLRRIKTGKQGSTEFDDDLGYALYFLAASAGLAGAAIEAVHLTDRTVTPVPMTDKKLGNRQKKIADFAGAIARGEFPAVTDRPERTCPRCPHFITCEAVPEGPLSLAG